MTAGIAITLDGRILPVRRGESLAAALAGNGVTVFRTTREGQPRGVFCGMGVCQDCLVEVDGRPNRRACMTAVEEPLTVRREAHARPLPPPAAAVAPPADVAAMRVERPELLVVGAGPGGLAAAIAARRAGAAVVVLDERTLPGGQYYKQVSADAVAAPDEQHRRGAALIAEARRLGVELRQKTLVWGAFAPHEFLATGEDGTLRFAPRAAIVAAGAYERGWFVPGWTLPGVMTTGAAQTLWRTARRVPGRRILVAGNGPLNLQLAVELGDGGGEVVGVAEAARRPAARDWRPVLAMAAASPGLLAAGLGYRARLRRRGVPVFHATVVSRIEAAAAGLSVTLAPVAGGGAPLRLEVDTVCLGYGFHPSNEILRALGCRHEFDAGLAALVPARDAEGRTSVPGVFALGDCVARGGAQLALAAGEIAGLAAARDLGHPVPPLAGGGARARLRRHRRFQAALWTLFAAPVQALAFATPDTLICRCEEVRLADIDAALAEGLASLGAVKRRTRAGLGRCQGRYCGPALEALIADRLSLPRGELSGFAPRPPLKPVAIDDLARLAP